MIPSQNALKFAVQLLRKLEHTGKLDAFGFERIGETKSALSLRGQAHDLMQVATFLESKIISKKKKP